MDKKIVKETEEAKLAAWESKKILGFILRRSYTTDKGRKYLKFYAFKSAKIEGKTVRANIYIGSDPTYAEKKIRDYCHKHNLLMLVE